MFNKLKDLAMSAASKGESLFNRTINKTLFTRVVMAGFLIASADGDFDSDEKKALARLIKKDLAEFSTDDVILVIRNCEDKIAFDAGLGLQEILDEIAKSAGNTGDAAQIMAVCAFIGRADGEYDADERKVALSVCYALKLSPQNYGLI